MSDFYYGEWLEFIKEFKVACKRLEDKKLNELRVGLLGKVDIQLRELTGSSKLPKPLEKKEETVKVTDKSKVIKITLEVD